MLFPPNVVKKWLYVLQLENDNYYVGITNNLSDRLKQHFNNSGSKWTQLHKPLSVVYLRSNVSSAMENQVTSEYKRKFGTAHVRGGLYCNVCCPDKRHTFNKR